MSTMLRPIFRSRHAMNKLKHSSAVQNATKRATAAFSTQSGDDTTKPTALAKLHLEDGTTITGTSFGSHEAVEGEVSW